MRSIRAVCIVVCLVFLQSCSGKKPSVSTSMKDSSSTVNSTTQATTQPQAAIEHLTYEEREGKFLYAKYCAVCHGDEGKGDGFNAYNLDPKPRDFTDSTFANTFSVDRVTRIISDGGRGVNKSPLMPPWGSRLTRQEVLYLVAYVEKLAESRPK